MCGNEFCVSFSIYFNLYKGFGAKFKEFLCVWLTWVSFFALDSLSSQIYDLLEAFKDAILFSLPWFISSFFLTQLRYRNPKSRWKRRRELRVHLPSFIKIKFGKKENSTKESSEKHRAPG